MAAMRFQSSSTRWIGVATSAFGLVGIGTLLLGGDADDLLTYGGALALVAFVGYAVLWAPYVEVDDGGVLLRNVLRTVHLPWPAIQEVDGRYGLRLDTAYGRFNAWAAPAPAGRDRLRGGDSEASAVVRRQLERFRGLGYLDNPRLESDTADVSWNLPAAVGLVVLALATAVGPLLA